MWHPAGLDRICPECLSRSELERCPGEGAETLALEDVDVRTGSIAGERFLLLERVGVGGMGRVYRAYQRSMQRFVAVKVLEGPTDPDIVERFRREARAAASLKSPHTITMFDFGELATGELYLAMELVEGRTLESVVAEEGPLPLERALRIADQICRSLEEAHEIGLVHRDVKPANIMLEQRGAEERAVLFDFGIVKLREGRAGSITDPSWMIGTPLYMPPEMWSNEHGAIAASTDLYSLGVVLFFMLTGRAPFQQQSVSGLVHAHLYERPLSLSSSRPDLPPALDRLLQRCLAKDPAKRHASALVLRADLASISAEPRIEAPRRPVVRAQLPVLAAAALSLIAALLLLSGRSTEPSAPLSIGPPQIIGDLAEAEVKSKIERLSPVLERCIRSGKHTLRFVIGGDGKASVRASDSELQRCLASADISLPLRSGAFATVSIRVER